MMFFHGNSSQIGFSYVDMILKSFIFNKKFNKNSDFDIFLEASGKGGFLGENALK